MNRSWLPAVLLFVGPVAAAEQPDGPYAQLVLNSEPAAYWRMGAIEHGKLRDHTEAGRHARVGVLTASPVPGPQRVGFCGPDVANQCIPFHDKPVLADLPDVGSEYSVELWFWYVFFSGDPPATACLFCRGPDGDARAPGDRVGISAVAEGVSGCLSVDNGQVGTSLLGGPAIREKMWHHLVFVRRGKSVELFLDGSTKPVVAGDLDFDCPPSVGRFCFGGRIGRTANLEVRLDEVAVYDRVLSPSEVQMHYRQSDYPHTPSVADFRKMEEMLPSSARCSPARPRRLLILDRANGFYHPTIPLANRAMELMGERTGAFQATVDHGYSLLTPERLAPYDGIVLNNTSNWRLSADQKKALIDYVGAGGGLMAIHGATWNFADWPEGQALIGGHLVGHPWHDRGTWAVKIDEPDHPLCQSFGGRGFWINDEIYQFNDVYSREKLRVLVSLDMTKEDNQVQGRRADNDQAISWIHRYGKGRVFYCSLGNNVAVFHVPEILQHHLDGIQWILGDLAADATPSSRLSARPIPALAPQQQE